MQNHGLFIINNSSHYCVYDVVVCLCVMMSSGGSAPKSHSLWDSVWRRLSAEGWRRWGSTECLGLQPTSRRWRAPLIQVSLSWFDKIQLWKSFVLVLYWLLCPFLLLQTTRTCPSSWGRWTWTPSLEHWSCISASSRSLCSLMSCTQTLLEPSVSGCVSNILVLSVKCDSNLWLLVFSSPLQLYLTVWPRRAACSTCCCLYQNPILSPSCSCLTTWRGERPHNQYCVWAVVCLRMSVWISDTNLAGVPILTFHPI